MNPSDEIAIKFIWVLLILMVVLFYLLNRDDDEL